MHSSALLLLLGLAAPAASNHDTSEDLSLLQVGARSFQRSKAGDDWADHVMGQMEKQWTTGFWAKPAAPLPGCGSSTFKELQVTIPKWQAQHPGVDGFCHFQNHAMWFAYAGSNDVYRSYGQGGLHQGRASFLCDSSGEVGKGPSVQLNYDGGNFTWSHMRNCIDIVDDPYCYSLGWLKGQGHWDESLMDNKTAWQQLAREQCDKLQDEFHFDDEEVTVGRHIFTTPLYFKRTWNSLQGATGRKISKRLHAEHVYTKCQLGHGGAPAEMAYCYYKGCVLDGGKRIGHMDECNYDP